MVRLKVDTMKVNAEQVLYIKLGRGGEWEDECINGGYMRFANDELPHALCLASNWDGVLASRLQKRNSQGAAVKDLSQIRYFYEAPEDTLWVTFWKGSLWWAFAKPEVSEDQDGTKVRPVVGGWRNTDAAGQPLLLDVLSGKVLAMQGFRGTICAVKERAYVLNKINAVLSQEVQEAHHALRQLEQCIEAIVKTLSWRDFELLIDLIFRQAGWQRVGSLGATTKTLDLDVMSPITSERFGVQVKAKADRALFDEYRLNRLKDMQGFTRFYFAVHSPSPNLLGMTRNEYEDVELLLPSDISRLSVQYGLANWIIDKAR